MRELKGGFFGHEIGDTFVQLDIEGLDGFEGASEEDHEFEPEAVVKNQIMGEKDYGHSAQPIRMPAKRFKEDDDDFYELNNTEKLNKEKRINR